MRSASWLIDLSVLQVTCFPSGLKASQLRSPWGVACSATWWLSGTHDTKAKKAHIVEKLQNPGGKTRLQLVFQT